MQIEFKQVNFAYGAGTPFETPALYDVSLTIPSKKYTALIGHTGSGKSTVSKHLNALLQPTGGEVIVGGKKVTAQTRGETLRWIRQHVGIVFQFPESQLFEETVLKDVMFGPMNYGTTQEKAEEDAIRALQSVGIDSELFQRSPFDLSGGQMRRVAIAGVVAMNPEVLVLDEPTAGLDPKGRRDMMTLFKKLQEEQALTIVLVTHQMNDVAEFADHVIVMENGTAIREGSPLSIFEDEKWLEERRLGLPDVMAFARRLEKHGILNDDLLPLNVSQLADSIALRYRESVGKNRGE